MGKLLFALLLLLIVAFITAGIYVLLFELSEPEELKDNPPPVKLNPRKINPIFYDPITSKPVEYDGGK